MHLYAMDSRTTKSIIAKVIGTSFGFGYAPKAPGTFGALFGVLVYLALYNAGFQVDYWLLGLIVIGTILGTWACGVLQSDWGDDPSRIVMDESVGVWITMLFMPYSLLNVLLAFGLFRLFDIWKPLGIKKIDRGMHTPFSVMLDDIIAGVYAWLALHGFLILMSLI